MRSYARIRTSTGVADMSAQIICNGRVVWSTPGPRTRRAELPVDRDGNVLLPEAVAPGSPKSIFTVGTPHYSTADRIWFRMLPSCPPMDGWASTDFWQHRWNADHKAVRAFAVAGYLDPAMEVGSQVARYRCRDEFGLRNSQTWRTEKNRILRGSKRRRKAEREEDRKSHG